MGVALSVGGSVIDSVSYIKNLCDVLKKCRNKFGVVVGGGALARKYIDAGREFNADESFLDLLGIQASRLNASLMIAALGKDAYPNPALEFNEVLTGSKSFKYVIMGGTHPGHTTDAVAAMLAERMGASKLIILTDVKGVYTADPKTNQNARFLKELSYEKLFGLAYKAGAGAGGRGVIDSLAAKIISRSKIRTYVLYGKDFKSLSNVLKGKKFEGSVIK